MDSKVIKVYCGCSHIISSLGDSLSENYLSIMDYTTNISLFKDNTPLCMINRDKLNLESLEEFTFAEKLSITAISNLISRSKVSLDNNRTLVIISTTKGNVECINSDFEKSYLWAISDKIASYFNSYNRPLIVSNACISGVASLIIGARFIEQGQYDNIYVLGVDIVSEFIVSGFNSFKSISPTICRPYDSCRDGLTLGEGCGAILLTNNRDLSDSKIVISGGGISDDANHISGPSRSGDGLYYAIKTAMDQSTVNANEISFVNTHGTGTTYNDEMESKALNMAQLTSVPCNSLKPYLGHTLGASGVIETILSIEQLYHNKIFGVKGHRECGLPFELNVSALHRDLQLKHCLKTASGFGGTNAAIILSKEADAKDKTIKRLSCEIVEKAKVEISSQKDMKFAEFIRGEYKKLGESNLKFFKMDDLSKLGYVASCLLMNGVDIPYPKDRIGVVIANRSASLDTDINHQHIVDQHLDLGSSPAIFVYTLANIVASEMAIKHKWQGELTVFVNKEKNMDFLSDYSIKLIENDLCDAVIYGWCELLKDKYNSELRVIIRK